MLRILTAVLLTALLWAGVAVMVVAINAQIGVHWNAEGGFLLVAALVLMAWGTTHLVLEGARRNLPYHP